jgi:hypothetical protein
MLTGQMTNLKILKKSFISKIGHDIPVQNRFFIINQFKAHRINCIEHIIIIEFFGKQKTENDRK